MEQLAETLDSGDEAAADTSTDTSAQADEVVTEEIDPTDSPETGDSTESEAPADEEEIDYDGEKYKVPKKLREAFLRQQDYTKKTQEVAETRKAVEAERLTLQQQAEQQQKFIAEYAQAYALDDQLKQYQQVNWEQMADADPVQAQKLWFQFQQLKERRDQVVASVTQKQQAQTLQQQQETARRMQEGRAVLEREIKGWGPETAKQLQDYGKELGFKDEELAAVSDPRSVKLLHKAWQFDQLMKNQATPKEKPEPQEKPIPRISASKGTAAKDPSKMSDAEFAAWRKRQIAQRR